MEENLLQGEALLKKYNAGFAITSHRLLYCPELGWGSRDFFSAPLSDVQLIEIFFRSRVWLLYAAFVALLAGMALDPLYLLGRDSEFRAERGLLIGVIPALYLVWKYLRSRKASLVLWIGAARREFHFPGHSFDSLVDFANDLHAARLGRLSA